MKDLTRYNEKEKIEKEQLCPVENVVTRLPEPSLVRKEVCICRILIRRVSVSSPLIPPVWLLPLSFPHATVSPISQGLGFIKALALLSAAFCNTLIISLRWVYYLTHRGQGGKTQHTHVRHKGTKYQPCHALDRVTS